MTEALREKLATKKGDVRGRMPPRMKGFGKLRHLRKKTARIQSRIEETFEVTEPEDRA